MHDVGSRLREMRDKRGLTQRVLAERINKSVSAISGYESNVQTPPMDVLISISQVLHVPITYFVDLDCEESCSLAGFTHDQKELLDLIFREFTTPTCTGGELSAQQIDIIRKLLLLFSKE